MSSSPSKMPKVARIRVTYPIPPELNHDCDRMHIDSYELKEVMLPSVEREPRRKAIQITIRGRNFRAIGQPLVALVGEILVSYLRIAHDERSVDGVLLKEPRKGSYIDLILGDLDAARHPTPFDPSMIQRIID